MQADLLTALFVASAWGVCVCVCVCFLRFVPWFPAQSVCVCVCVCVLTFPLHLGVELSSCMCSLLQTCGPARLPGARATW